MHVPIQNGLSTLHCTHSYSTPIVPITLRSTPLSLCTTTILSLSSTGSLQHKLRLTILLSPFALHHCHNSYSEAHRISYATGQLVWLIVRKQNRAKLAPLKQRLHFLSHNGINIRTRSPVSEPRKRTGSLQADASVT